MLNFLLEKTKSRIGIDISPEGAALSFLTARNNIVSVKNQVFKPFPREAIHNGQVEKPEVITEAIKETITGYKLDTLSTVVSMPSNVVFIKRISMPDIPYEELGTIAPQEAAKYLPLGIKELNVDFQVLENTRRQDESGRKIDVIICAVSKLIAKSYIDPVHEAGLAVEMLDIAPFSAIRTLANEGLVNDSTKTYVSVLIGYENTDINIIQDGMPVFSHNIGMGKKNVIEGIINTLHKKREEVLSMLGEVVLVIPGEEMSNNQELNQAASAAKNIYNHISGEIQKTVEFFNSGNPVPLTLEKVIVSGAGACVGNIDKFLSNRLKTETFIFDPLFSTSTGSALKRLEN